MRMICNCDKTSMSVTEMKSAGPPGWARRVKEPSLPEVYRSINVPGSGTQWKKALAFAGPGYLVAVGYMDPGNWATSLAAGSKFGYTLLIAALVSNIMAIILQALSARLAIGANRDLAQACRDAYPRPIVWMLWFLAELAIIATDIAEVIGTAIGLNLVFGISIETGVFLTSLDVLLILYLQKLGFRWIEAIIIGFLSIIFACFGIQLFLANPDWSSIGFGFLPKAEIVQNPEMLYLALGILGATVMPHNLYLHSSIVQTRQWGKSEEEKKSALKFSVLDSTTALIFAFSINAAILILAAATFNKNGYTNIIEIGQAWSLLEPILNNTAAPLLFGIALLCCGLSSTITATLAGQIVIEGFLEIRLAPWIRRLLTRIITIAPAALVTVWYGESGIGKLLIFSQVVLSLQLSFAVFPLVLFTSDRAKMQNLTAPRMLSIAGFFIAVVIAGLNLKLLFDMLT